MIWACGSGGTPDEYYAGDISSLVFRSDDGGATFELEFKIPNSNPSGDARFTGLAEVDGDLVAFGYRTDGTTTNVLIAYRTDGDELVPWEAMQQMFVQHVESLNDGTAIAAGVFAAGTLRAATVLMVGDEALDLAGFDDRTVLDIAPVDGSRVLLMSVDGSDFPLPSGPWDVEVGLWDSSDGSYSELVRHSSNTLPTAVAFWRDSLYIGLEDGRVRRAEGSVDQ